MSTETGARESRLSKSTTCSESETGAIDTATKKSGEDSDTAKHTDEKHVHHISNKDETQDVRELHGTGQEEKTETAVKPSATTVITDNPTQDIIPGDGSRQIIAVSANKNPTAFFQLARKFLMTNEMCDLSALEGAIVSAVDAAHLLERSKLATIVRIHTSYVNVEPKRRRQQKVGVLDSEASTKESEPSTRTSKDASLSSQLESSTATSSDPVATLKTRDKLSTSTRSRTENDRDADTIGGGIGKAGTTTSRSSASGGGGSRELRRARILVTVKRTESYKRWLEENPNQRQAIIAGTATVTAEEIVGADPSSPPSTETESPSSERKKYYGSNQLRKHQESH